MHFITKSESGQLRYGFLGLQKGSSGQAEVTVRETGAGDTVGKGGGGLGADAVSCLGGVTAYSPVIISQAAYSRFVQFSACMLSFNNNTYLKKYLR